MGGQMMTFDEYEERDMRVVDDAVLRRGQITIS